MVVVPGGFSYGDYLRSGAIARYSPIMQEVSEFADKGGLVMGICNGFQILTESRLLPGALLRNKNQQFICENVYLKAAHSNAIFSRKVPTEKLLKIPIAHGEGRFYADETTLAEIEANNQVIFRYCSPEGTPDEAWNLNGSLNAIAGVTNKKGNVFGMMPHPERASNPILGNTDGALIFESILDLVTA
jgi:phosphoribosylformylglycinamidine synthase